MAMIKFKFPSPLRIDCIRRVPPLSRIEISWSSVGLQRAISRRDIPQGERREFLINSQIKSVLLRGEKGRRFIIPFELLITNYGWRASGHRSLIPISFVSVIKFIHKRELAIGRTRDN
jgi:hypothetical protein